VGFRASCEKVETGFSQKRCDNKDLEHGARFQNHALCSSGIGIERFGDAGGSQVTPIGSNFERWIYSGSRADGVDDALVKTIVATGAEEVKTLLH